MAHLNQRKFISSVLLTTSMTIVGRHMQSKMTTPPSTGLSQVRRALICMRENMNLAMRGLNATVYQSARVSPLVPTLIFAISKALGAKRIMFAGAPLSKVTMTKFQIVTMTKLQRKRSRRKRLILEEAQKRLILEEA